MVVKMRLREKYFDLIKSGRKKLEIRCYDEKRRLIENGDIIEFTKSDSEQGNDGEKMYVKVKQLHVFKSFQELFSAVSLSDLGCDGETPERLTDTMRKIYTEEKEKNTV